MSWFEKFRDRINRYGAFLGGAYLAYLVFMLGGLGWSFFFPESLGDWRMFAGGAVLGTLSVGGYGLLWWRRRRRGLQAPKLTKRSAMDLLLRTYMASFFFSLPATMIAAQQAPWMALLFGAFFVPFGLYILKKPFEYVMTELTTSLPDKNARGASTEGTSLALPAPDGSARVLEHHEEKLAHILEDKSESS